MDMSMRMGMSSLAARSKGVGVTAENVTGENYPLVWQDTFQSLSLRTGGPTPAGYASGKGTWTPAGLWYRPGTSETAKGNEGFGHDFFIDPDYDWQAIDPTFPPLGMIDIAADGLVLRGTGDYPLIRASVPAAQEESVGSNLINGVPSAGGLWYNNNGAGASNGSSVDGLPVPNIVTTAGNTAARREYFEGAAVTSGETYAHLVKFNYGTSGKLLVAVDYNGAGSTIITCAGSVATITDTGSGTPTNVSVEIVDNHLELRFDLACADTGYLNLGAGPNSSVNGETVILYDFQTLADYVPRLDAFLSAMVTSLYSAKVKPPFYRETEIWVPGGDEDFPAVWGLGNKSAAADLAKSFEVDEFERFGDVYADSITHAAVHIATTTGPDYNMFDDDTTFDVGSSLIGRWIKVGVQVTATEVKAFFDGVLAATFTVPVGGDPDDLMHSILNLSIGRGFLPYPSGFTGTSEMKVRSVKYYAPASNTTGVFPTAPPVPAIAWGGSFTGGAIPVATASGTTVATLSGAATYAVLGGGGKLVVDGTALKTSGSLSAGDLDFYIEGTDAGGVPGIAPMLTATVA